MPAGGAAVDDGTQLAKDSAMATEHEPETTTEASGSPTTSGMAARLFIQVEHAAYLATGVLLACTAVLALVSGAISLVDAGRSWGAPDEIIVTIDRLLFVLMLLEILHTVRVSVRDGTLTPEPFLVVGLIASIRRVLVITLGSSQATHPGNWTQQIQEQFNASMLELGVLGLLILVMVFAIYLLRRGRHAPAAPTH
jgi:uncharacterized membrane protein (DUF373 family)